MFDNLKQLNLKDLPIRTKLLILALVPILGLLYFAISDSIARVSDLNEANEITRLTNFLEQVGNYVDVSQVERGASVTFVASRGTAFQDEVQTQRVVVDEQLVTLRQVVDDLRADNLDAEFYRRADQALADADELPDIRQRIDNLAITEEEILETYTRIHNELFDAILFIPVISSDPQISTRISAFGMLLFEKDAVGRQRALVADILERVANEDQAVIEFQANEEGFLVDAFTELFAAIDEQALFDELFIDYAAAEEVQFRNELLDGNPVVEELTQIKQTLFASRAEGDFDALLNLDITSEDWFALSTQEISLLKELENGILNDIRTVADADAALAQNQLTFFGVFSAVLITITVLMAVFIVRGINSQITNLTEVFDQIQEGVYTSRAEIQGADELGQMTGNLNTMLDSILTQIDGLTELFSEIGIGNFDARAEIQSDDPLGQLTANLNAMLDNTLSLIQTQDERDALQSAILKLLEEVSGVAEGDLTVEAEVTEDATGAIADSFNFMIEQLREVISRVQDATLQVSSSANEIQTTAESLSQGSETQATQIINTSAAVDEMSISIQQVSENASISASVAEQALANARQGSQAVQNTIEGMDRIRDQVQETSKRIKRLGESSQEIGEIVQLISDIADRTSILALNASIQAAMAGEAGRGFAVVAEEVERLAERSNDATEQIANLVKTIQSETNETVAAMEESTQEVVKGSELANQAGQALTEIESVSNRLAELSQSISSAATQQAQGSEAVAQSMNDIAEVTQQTAVGTKEAALSINNLTVLADDLRGSVSAFKLPSTNGHAA